MYEHFNRGYIWVWSFPAHVPTKINVDIYEARGEDHYFSKEDMQ